jgi:hypothetical protein
MLHKKKKKVYNCLIIIMLHSLYTRIDYLCQSSKIKYMELLKSFLVPSTAIFIYCILDESLPFSDLVCKRPLLR